ncbi:sigma-70 family RNA polymerase sigma factor [Aquisphaera insulae]|uniref:sigma-70 family RNA polymerase sigma factor n=1 Tax=Aquisphaera insulae TaxID=2712864 RepID=UPI0013EB2CB9|nr:sigma-70 family RNA polymerase sigma factor [Aquisphaera insulae]
MERADLSDTRPSLLLGVKDWDNRHDWRAFQAKYDPLVRACGRAQRLHDDEVEEFRQQAWIKIAHRMKVFVYDPSQSFRGWVWRVAWRTGLDFLARRDEERWLSIDERDEAAAWQAARETVDDAAGGTPELDRRRRIARRIQESVRLRVLPETWEAFWIVAVLGLDVVEAKRRTGLAPASVYKARQRVLKMLRDEARRDPEASTFAED